MKQIFRFYVSLFIFILPISFLPFVIDSFVFGKNILVMLMTLLGLVLWVVSFLSDRSEEIKVNRGWWLMFFVTVWAWIGWTRLAPGVQIKSLTDVSGVGILTTGLIWFFLWLQVSSQEERKSQINWLTASGILVAVTSIIIFLIPSVKFPINIPKENPLLSINYGWSLAGFVMTELLLMLFLVLEWGKRLVVKLKSENYIIEALVTSFFSLIMFLDIYRIIKSGWVNLDGNTAWVVAVEAFKQSPIWGVGAGNFISAFTMFRPATYNVTANWANSFLHSSNGILNIWTELGIVGLVAVVVSIIGLLKLKKNFDFVKLSVMVLAGLFMPVNLTGMMLIVWLVSGILETKKIKLMIKAGENGYNVAPIILGIVLFMGSIFGGYKLFLILLADIQMRNSMVAASKNNGGDTYNFQIKAIGLNPDNADYRRVYSQTNLSLASTLLANKEISEEDKQKASTLVQQAVREGKAAIALDEKNPNYWLNLAVIYRQLVGIVDGSADWSYQAYTQAVVLDPTNPISKLDLGGLLFAAKKYEEADRIFEEVVNAKPDFANGWYNWAYTAKELKKLEFAVTRLTQAVSLVPVTSGDYEKANTELIAWKKELAASAQGAVEPTTETLKTAEPLPTGSANQVVVPTGTELEPPIN